ncbi:hypothetical protein SRHO_G00123510 [Serrasalmus rhombeus]
MHDKCAGVRLVSPSSLEAHVHLRAEWRMNTHVRGTNQNAPFSQEGHFKVSPRGALANPEQQQTTHRRGNCNCGPIVLL